MKKKIALGLILVATTMTAQADMVPLDMELGYWETTTKIEESEMVRNMLASVPEAQRAQMRQMMQGSVESNVDRQCITADSFKDMEKQMMESFGNDNPHGCQFEVTKSSSKELLGTVTCSNMPSTIHTRVIDSKHHESTVISVIPGMGENKILSTAQWISADCPADLK